MSNAEISSNLADHLVRNTKWWIANAGYTPEAAWAQAMKSSCAGPVPRNLARERLGMAPLV